METVEEMLAWLLKPEEEIVDEIEIRLLYDLMWLEDPRESE